MSAVDDAMHLSVLVVDRRRAVAEALAGMLKAAGLSAYAASGDPRDQPLETAVGDATPSVLVLDAEGSPANVSARIAAARRARPDVRVLLLCDEPDDVHDRLATEAGALGWITRHSSREDLLDALHRAHSDRPPEAATGTAPNPADGPSEHPRLRALTGRELEVLRALMAGERAHVAAARLGISPHTVRTHVQNILGKLGVRTRFEAAAVARDAGLRRKRP